MFPADESQTPEPTDGDDDLDMQDNEDDGESSVSTFCWRVPQRPLVDDYIDYDSDYEAKRNTGEVDPYAGKFGFTTVRSRS